MRRSLRLAVETWDYHSPFVIAGYVFNGVDVLVAEVIDADAIGRGEAAGVYYLDETGDSMLADAERVRDAVESGASRQELAALLPAGGARNAIDCALWHLEAMQGGTTVFDLTGTTPAPAITAQTISIGSPEIMASAAAAIDGPLIKVKLDGTQPLERLSAVRRARPDAAIIVDANQGWTFPQLERLAPAFASLGVELIEQPLPRGADAALDGYRSPVPLCADESCLHTGELDRVVERYQVLNIKLDKTGGLTEALALAERAKVLGMDRMVGNMTGTSLAMAPAFVVAQQCRFVDLDGPMFLKSDRPHAMRYEHGRVSAPDRELWG